MSRCEKIVVNAAEKLKISFIYRPTSVNSAPVRSTERHSGASASKQQTMQQLPHSAYMPQQWSIPPLWNTNGNWYNNLAPRAQQVLPADWHAYVNNAWRAQQMQNMQLQRQRQRQLQRPTTTAIPASNHARPAEGAKINIAAQTMTACGSTSESAADHETRQACEASICHCRFGSARQAAIDTNSGSRRRQSNISGSGCISAPAASGFSGTA